jgi:mRNA interferase RelE/StbE
MQVKLSPKAQKFLDRQNEPERGQIVKALEKLEREPPEGNIKKLSGHEGYRLRLGGIRFLFEKRKTEILVTNIGRRGQVYKGKGKHK